MTRIRGNHHLTLSVGGAQEDYDFHTGLLGLRPIKKTVLYDGTVPIYHLYYGNAGGDAGAIITCFPMRQLGLMGRAGSNQVKLLNLSVPDVSLDWWANRLDDNAVPWESVELFGLRRLHFAHPCGIEYALIGEADGSEYGEAWGGNGVPAEHGIRGTYGITASVLDHDPMDHYLTVGPARRSSRTRVHDAATRSARQAPAASSSSCTSRAFARAPGTSPRAQCTTSPTTSATPTRSRRPRPTSRGSATPT
jgi:glyoxalase family protein